jgi:3-deoxy-D-manno-octulosonic acid kinase
LSRTTEIVARPGTREALESWVRDAGTLANAAAAHPDAATLEGRGRVFVVPAPAGTGFWAVRHYHRGGAVASLLDDRYLRLGTPRPVREFRVGRALEEMGVPTPRHVGGAVYRCGPWYRGDLVTEYVSGSRDLAGVLFHDDPSPFDAGRAMRAAGSAVRLLHERGGIHRDLNLKNILVAGGAGPGSEDGVGALILDLDRASLRSGVSERARRRMLDRFWRSARKWERKTGRRLEDGVEAAFREGYREWGTER